MEKKWENLSSDDEDEVHHDQQAQKEEQQQEEPKQSEQNEQTEGQQDQEDKPQEKKLSLYEQKAQIIDEIKKQSGQKVAIFIHRVDFNASIEDIKQAFKDVNISRIYKEDRPGMFTLEFDNSADGIHFAKVAPRIINGRKFFIRLSNKIRKDRDEWSQIGMGGKIINKPRFNRNFNNNAQQGSRPHYKTNMNKQDSENQEGEQQQQDEQKTENTEQQQNKPERKTFEQKPRTNNYEQKREGQEYTKKPYQKNNNYNRNYNNSEQQEGGERPSYQARGFHKGGNGEQQQYQRGEKKDQGFSRSNKGQEQQKPKTEKPTDDGWSVAK